MNIGTFPKEITALRQWVGWRLETDKNGRDTKVPYNPATGRRASSGNPATWGTLEETLFSKDKYLFSGVGFVFTEESGIIGIDIDHCLTDGQPNDVAAAILAKLPPTYIEVSPSGSGLHIFLHGKLPVAGSRSSKHGVEIYSSGRYFTMTGNRWRDCADSIADDNGVAVWIYNTFIATKRSKKVAPAASPTVLTDDELLALAHASKDSAAFDKLYRGEWQDKYKSQSEADFALCCKLAFWSGRNETQIDRLFRQSGLFREKWDTSHSADGTTYGSQSIQKACGCTVKVYTPPQKKPELTEIFEQNGIYYRNKNQKIYPLTNFIVEPIEMISSDEESQLTCDLVTIKGERFRQCFLSNDFSNLQKLKNVLSKRTISLSFLGGEGDLELFKMFVDNLNWTKKRGVKALGIYPRKTGLVFVDTKGAVGVSGNPVNEIVQLEKYKGIESDILKSPFIDLTGLRLLGKHIFTHNLPSRTVPILAWCAACFIKPHLRKSDIKFPHLFLVGEPGSGKSSALEFIIQPFFSRTTTIASSQVTSFTLMKESNSSNVIPQFFDEFKPSKMEKLKVYALYNHLRASYDGHEGLRGRADQTQVAYDLLAPIAVSGEESADESAIRERTVELLFAKRDHKKFDHRESFEWMKANRDILRSFGRSLLDTALRISPKTASVWHDEGREYFDKSLPERVLNNLCSMFAGICLMGKLCKSLGLAFSDVFPLDHEACAANLEYAAREYLLDNSSYNKGAVEQAFEVMARMKLKANEDFAF